MEKLKPTYLLATIKAAFASAEGLLSAASKTALTDAAALGLSEQEVVGCIQGIESGCFYKSMTTDRDSRIWQDVYYVPLGERVLYVKFTSLEGGRLFLISFKPKEK